MIVAISFSPTVYIVRAITLKEEIKKNGKIFKIYNKTKINVYLGAPILLFWFLDAFAISILDFSLLLLVKLSLLILFASFLVLVLCFFFYGSLSKVIALPTISIAILVALSRS